MPFSAEPSKEARFVQRALRILLTLNSAVLLFYFFFIMFFLYAQKHLQNAGTAAETAGFSAPPKLQRPFSVLRGHVASTAALSSLPGNRKLL